MTLSPAKGALPHRDRLVYTLALIVSLVCLFGLSLDLLAISLNPIPSSIEWRMGYMQQVGERCIILLFAMGLLGYSCQARPMGLKRIAWLCLGLGLCMSLSSVFYLRDSFQFRSLAIANLSSQTQNLEQRIQTFTPPTSSMAVDPAKKERAIELLGDSAQSLESRAKIGIQKTVSRTFFSFFLVGLGLMRIGQIALSSNVLPAPDGADSYFSHR